MTFYFAWAGAGDTVFTPVLKREDEQVISFEVSHDEGAFASLAVSIKNPRRNLLAGNVWAWLSEDDTPLFYGRLVTAPEDVDEEIVRLTFIARPLNFLAQKMAVAESLKVFPYFDPVWLSTDRLEDPDVVLEARADLWHIDRLTHVVTTSSINSGEDGTFVFSSQDLMYDDFNVTYGAAPLRRIRVEATISWDQQSSGQFDLSHKVVEGFAKAGSSPGYGLISTYTGQGLITDWPKPSVDLRGGWTIGDASAERVDGMATRPVAFDAEIEPPSPKETEGSRAQALLTPPFKARFYRWDIRPRFIVNYDVSRQRIEHVSFNLEAGVQSIITEAGDPDFELFTISSQKVSESPLGGDASSAPIGDVRRNAYLKTDRGRQSLEYLIKVARAKLLSRARAVDVRFVTTFERAQAFSCRHNVSLTDYRLPGGSAVGKIKAYSFGANGDGDRFGKATIGCTIGTGDAIVIPPYQSSYSDGYTGPGYDFRPGAAFVIGDVFYNDFSDTVIADDNVNFAQLTADNVVIRTEVTQGSIASQQAAIYGPYGGKWPDIAAVVESLNAQFTVYCMDLKPLTGGPFETTYRITVSQLTIPKTISL